MFIWSILVLIFIFLQSTVLSVDMVTVLVLWALLVWPVRRAWMAATIVGLLSDLIYGRLLGLSSIWYLGLGMGLWLYGRRYSTFHPIFLGLAVLGTMLISNWLLMKQSGWWWALVVSVVAVAGRRWLIEWQWGGKLRLN